MDYTHWTLDELEELREYLATGGVGAQEKDAVTREIQRRESAPPSTAGRDSDGTSLFRE